MVKALCASISKQCQLLGLLGISLVGGVAQAQREHPISSELRISPGFTARPGKPFDVTLAVTIPAEPEVWHFYSITQPEGGRWQLKSASAPRRSSASPAKWRAQRRMLRRIQILTAC